MKTEIMKKTTYFLFSIFFIIIVCFGFVEKNSNRENNKEIRINKKEKDSIKTLRPKDLNVKSFIKLFTEKYADNESLNLITLSGEFPENWVKNEDIEYLMSLIKSKKKCCSYINIYSSFMTTEQAEVGGFAIIFMNSLIENKKINLGLTNSPKTDIKEIEKIESWYKNRINK